jgi:ABC-type dipeptide/oligopeptide/nickel transport system ATPase component
MKDLLLFPVKDLRTYFDCEEGLVKAVDGVSFDGNFGERVGLVSKSESGKYVSALSLMRLIEKPAGYIQEGKQITLKRKP